MTEAEIRKMERLEKALLHAYISVDNLLTETPITAGPNGRVMWYRTKHLRDELKEVCRDISPDKSGTIPMVL